jgi:hypothetical protein
MAFSIGIHVALSFIPARTPGLAGRVEKVGSPASPIVILSLAGVKRRA